MDKTGHYDFGHSAPLDVIHIGRKRLYEIADELETMADNLGRPYDVRFCSMLVTDLQIDLPLCQRDEEALFDLMLLADDKDQLLSKCIQQSRSQHAVIQDNVFELLEPLGDMGRGKRLPGLDSTGYMLRLCFDGMRQHLEWEEVTIFSKLESLEPQLDLAQLRQALLHNRSRFLRSHSTSKLID